MRIYLHEFIVFYNIISQKKKGNILPVAPLSNNKTDNIVKDTHICIKIIMCILKYGFI